MAYEAKFIEVVAEGPGSVQAAEKPVTLLAPVADEAPVAEKQADEPEVPVQEN